MCMKQNTFMKIITQRNNGFLVGNITFTLRWTIYLVRDHDVRRDHIVVGKLLYV